MNAKVDQAQKSLYVELGKKIKSTRGERLSQAELAKASFLSRTSITNIEKGRQHLPIHTLYAIANALHIQVSDLLPDQDQFLEKALLDNIPVDLHPGELEWIKEEVASATNKKK